MSSLNHSLSSISLSSVVNTSPNNVQNSCLFDSSYLNLSWKSDLVVELDLSDKKEVGQLCWKNDYHYIRQLLENSVNKEGVLTQMLHQSIKHLYFQICTNQQTSRFLQKLVAKTSLSIVQDIYILIKPRLKALLINVYSNYFCQKLYARLTIDSQDESTISRSDFLHYIMNNLRAISCNKTGTFSIQKIVEIMESNSEKQLILNELDKIPNDELSDICTVSLIRLIKYLFFSCYFII
jgi:hypothetical protein